MAKNGLKLSTMVGENFEIYMSEMAKNGLNPNPYGGALRQIATSLKICAGRRPALLGLLF